MSIKIIQAICDLGVFTDGASLGAASSKDLIKDKEILENISSISCVYDKKSNDLNDKAKNIDSLNIFNERLYQEVLKARKENFIPLVIGGDHSLSIASALASIKCEKSMGVIWVDAHTDFNTFESTMSGNIHGMPLATITNNNGSNLTKFHQGPFYKNENTIIFGVRDIDKPELEVLKKCNIKFFSTKEVDDNFNDVMREGVGQALKNTDGLHLSIDIDVIDPSAAPGVSVRVKDGLSFERLIEILDFILQYKDKIKSIDIVEFNPKKDKDDKTREILGKLINYFLSKNL